MPPKTYIAIDVETTGLDPYSDRIVEIGALAFDAKGNDISRFQSLVNPGRPIPERVSAIHGIVDADVADAPAFDVVARAFFGYLDGFTDKLLIAHNAAFDTGFINAETDRHPPSTIPGSPSFELLSHPVFFTDHKLVLHPVFCTMHMSQRINRHVRRHNLASLVASLGLPEGRFHRSMADCFHCKNLFMAMKLTECDLEREMFLQRRIHYWMPPVPVRAEHDQLGQVIEGLPVQPGQPDDHVE